MKRSLTVFAVAVCLAACATPPAASGLSAESALAGKECRKIPLPGSNIIKRDCKTAAEWAKHDSEEAARNAALLGNSRTARDPYTLR